MKKQNDNLQNQINGGRTTQNQLEQAEKDVGDVNEKSTEVLESLE